MLNTTTTAFDGNEPATVSPTGNSVTIRTDVAAIPGQRLIVTANAVANPATTGSQAVSVASSSDPVPVTQMFNFTAPTSVSSTRLALTSTSTTATQVTYTASFVVTNAVTAGFSTVTLTAPAGTTFPAAGGGNYTVSNSTTTASNGNEPATVSATGNGVTIRTDVAATPGQRLVVTANAVGNPATTGPQAVSVASSSDPVPVTQMFSFTAPTAVSSSSITPTSTSANATEVTYTASFVVTNAVTAGFSTVSLTAPAGTVFPAAGGGNYTVSNSTTTASNGNEPATVSAAGSSVTIRTDVAATPGQRLVVTANGVVTPTTTGSQAFSVATTSDPVPVVHNIALTAPTQVLSPSLALSDHTHGASGVTYTVQFTVRNALTSGYSTLTLAAPAGTAFPGAACSYSVTDDTTSSGGGCLAVTVLGGNAATITVPTSAVFGDHVTVTVTGVTNAPSIGAQSLAFSSSSDPAPAALGFSLT